MAKPSGLLIDLLNEYKPKQSKFITSEIISKKFGFIKWLVENDKIYMKGLEVYKLELRAKVHKYVEYSSLEQIIMLLSISDEPIQDLISLLK